MAVISALPEQAIIDQYKGSLDFYLWKGIPCVRKWPVHKPRWRSTSELQTSADFAYAGTIYPQLSQVVVDAYKAIAKGYYLTWRDYLTRSYISGISYRTGYPHYDDVPHLHEKVQIMDFDYHQEGLLWVWEWWTDIPCYSVSMRTFYPFRKHEVTRERRGVFWYKDFYIEWPEVRFYVGTPWNVLSDYHYAYTYKPIPPKPLYVAFLYRFQPYAPYDWSPSNSPIFVIQ